MTYKMRFLTSDDGFFGHMAVEIIGPNDERTVRGFYPKNIVKAASLTDVGGVVEEEKDIFTNHDETRESQWHTIDKKGYDNALKMMDDAKAGKGEWAHYDANDRNCYDFGDAVRKAAGLKGTIDDHLTSEQKSQVTLGNGYSTYRYGGKPKTPMVNLPMPTWQPDEPAKPSAKADDLKGGGADDILGPPAKASAESKKWVEDFIKDDGPKDVAAEAMLKRPDIWTADEARAVTAKRMNMAGTDPAYDKMEKAERAFYSAHYGDDAVGYDSTGKMEEPVAKRQIAHKPAPLTSPDGKKVRDGMKKVAENVQAAAQKGDLISAVKGLQSGVNIWKTPAGKTLKTDGVAGPKTKAAVQNAVAKMGAPKVRSAQAVGTLDQATQNPKTASDPARLKKAVDDNIGPLLGTAKSGESTKSGEAFQGAVNDTGQDALGTAFQPIKEDGFVGPKTTEAFAQVAAADRPGLFDKLGRGIGLFG